MIRVLGMAPSSAAREKTWFSKLWEVEWTDPKNHAYVPTTRPKLGEDGDTKVLHDQLVEVSQAIGPKDPNLQNKVNANSNLHDGLRSSHVTKEEARVKWVTY